MSRLPTRCEMNAYTQFEVKFIEIAEARRIFLGSPQQQMFIHLRPAPRRCRFSDAHRSPNSYRLAGQE